MIVNIAPKEICKAIEELLNENERLKESEKLKYNKLYGQFVKNKIENERLKSQNKLYETFFNSNVEAREKLIEKVHRLQFIIEKAIKFINENKCEIELDEYLLLNCLHDNETIELLKILEGVNNE